MNEVFGKCLLFDKIPGNEGQGPWSDPEPRILEGGPKAHNPMGAHYLQLNMENPGSRTQVFHKHSNKFKQKT